MLTLPWVKQARCTHAPSEARAWVDDLTWWGRGDPEALCRAVSRVEDVVATLRDEYDLVANMTKSCVLGQNQAMIDLLRGRDTALGLPVAHAFKDLGVAQGRGSESRIIMRKRWHVATQRMARIAKLAVDFGSRGKFLANRAMVAGAYGAGAGPTSVTAAAWLRRWAVHAV